MKKFSNIPTVKAVQVYDAVYELANDTVKSYREDLTVHDQKTILNNEKDLFFIHMTRKTGTQLYMLVLPSQYPIKGEYIPYLFGKANREQLLKSNVESVKYSANESEKFIFYNGKEVKEITKDKVLEIIKDYEKQIIAGFQRIDYNNENNISYQTN